jgi:hypothetical protein
MPFHDTIARIGSRLGQAGGRFFGNLGNTVRRVAEWGKPVGKLIGNAGRFIMDAHQPLSMLAHGLGEATGNQTMKNIGTAAMIGSGLASAAGIGTDYLGLNNPGRTS